MRIYLRPQTSQNQRMMDIDRRKLIQFMMEFFNDEEVVMLCLMEFRDVHSNFAAGMGKRQKVLDVVAWCDRHGEMDKLLAALQREREKLFLEWFGEQPVARPPISSRNQMSTETRIHPITGKVMVQIPAGEFFGSLVRLSPTTRRKNRSEENISN